jgi:hypothetical protein
MTQVAHVLDLILFLITVMGPLPLGIGFIVSRGGNRKNHRLPHFLFTLLTVWTISQVLIGIILGIAGQLGSSQVFVTEMLMFTAGALYLRRLKKKNPSLRLMDNVAPPGNLTTIEKYMTALLIVLGIAVGVTIGTQPISDYDSLAYHLPAMATWYQQGDLSPNDQFKNDQIGSYPYNSELLSTLFFYPFGDDTMAVFPNLIVWLQMVLAIYLISVQYGADRLHGLLAASLVSMLPIVILGITIINTDLPLMVLFLAGYYYIRCYRETPTFFYFLLSMQSITMLPGIKTSGFLYGFVLFILLTLQVMKQCRYRNKSDKPKTHLSVKRVVFPIMALIAAVIPGIYWYIMNLIRHGNPLGYVEVKAAGITIFPGTINVADIWKTTLAGIFDFFSPKDWKIFLEQIHIKLGIGFFIVFTLAVVYLAALLLKNRLKNIKHYGLLVLMLGVTGYIYWNTPYSADNGLFGYQITAFVGQGMRYGLSFMGVTAIIAALAAQKIKLREQTAIILFLFGYAGAMYQVGKLTHTMLPLYVTGFILIAWEVLRHVAAVNQWTEGWRNTSGSKKKVVLSIIIVILVVQASFLMRQERNKNRERDYGAASVYIDKNIKPDEKIGYYLSHRSYIFYGSRLDKSVRYIPLDLENENQFLRYIKKHDIRLIAIGPLQKDWLKSNHYLWIKNNKKKFERVHGKRPNRNILIYRVKQ